MKTVVIRFSGAAAPDDLILITGRHPKGGQCAVKCRIGGADAPHAAIPEASDLGRALAIIADEINGGGEFMKGEYAATAKDRYLVVKQTNIASDVVIGAEVQGHGTLSFEMEIL